MATLSIALVALRDIAKLNSLESLGEEIHEDYLIHRRGQDLKRLKVVPRLGDRSDYESIIEGTPAGAIAAAGLLGGYSFFKREWKRHVGGDGETAIRRYLVAATARLSLVTIIVGGENPYEIFESLNSCGLPLEESDLIRNFLFMQVPLEEQDRFQSTHWEKFEKRFDAAGEYEKLSPTLFYRSYLMREGNYCRNRVTYIEFKRQNDARNIEPAAQVEELQKFAKFELWLRRPLTCEDPNLRDAFVEIQALDITTAHPLLLHLLDIHQKGRLDRANLLGCFKDLASFVIRRSILQESTRGYGRMFPGAINAIQLHFRDELRAFFLHEGWPDDAAFIPYLAEFPIYKRERNKCRLLLERLEREHGHHEEVNLKLLSVEHVLPQTINGDSEDSVSWQNMLGGNWRVLHEKWIHTLGNLTLTGYNPELSNSSFANKKVLFAESNVSLHAYFAALEQWTDREIKQRGLELAKIIAGIWPRPAGGPNYNAPIPTPSESGELFEDTPRERSDAGRRGRSRIRIRVHWSQMHKAGGDEEFCEPDAAETVLRFVEKLIRVFGSEMAEKLTRIPVIRYPLSDNPTVAFLNVRQGRPHSHTLVPGTGLYLCTISSNPEKRDRVLRMVDRLELPAGSVEITLVV